MRPSAEPAAEQARVDDGAGDPWWALLEDRPEPVALIDAQRGATTRANAAFRKLEQRHALARQRSPAAALAAQLAGCSRARPTIAFDARLPDGVTRAATASPAAGAPGLWLVLLEAHGEGPDPAPPTRDAVTGIADRRWLEADLARRFQRDRPFAVVFIDLDGFKQINDSQGHLAGDDALREIATRLSECVRDSDLIGRFGGDEFVVVLADAASEEDVTPIVRRVEEAVAHPLASIDGQASVSASIGSALSCDGYRTPREMLNAADLRMYASKRAGGDAGRS